MIQTKEKYKTGIFSFHFPDLASTPFHFTGWHGPK
jgi:hypothetical protein